MGAARPLPLLRATAAAQGVAAGATPAGNAVSWRRGLKEVESSLEACKKQCGS